jgi:hypothetical protein
MNYEIYLKMKFFAFLLLLVSLVNAQDFEFTDSEMDLSEEEEL